MLPGTDSRGNLLLQLKTVTGFGGFEKLTIGAVLQGSDISAAMI
jgi:hypothetical protein